MWISQPPLSPFFEIIISRDSHILVYSFNVPPFISTVAFLYVLANFKVHICSNNGDLFAVRRKIRMPE